MKCISQPQQNSPKSTKSIIKLCSKVKIHQLTDQQFDSLKRIENGCRTKWMKVPDQKGNINLIKQFVVLVHKKVYNLIDVYRVISNYKKLNSTVFEDVIMQGNEQPVQNVGCRIEDGQACEMAQLEEMNSYTGLYCPIRRHQSVDMATNQNTYQKCGHNIEQIIQCYKTLT